MSAPLTIKGNHPRHRLSTEDTADRFIANTLPWRDTMDTVLSQANAHETLAWSTIGRPPHTNRRSYPTPWKGIVMRESKNTGVSVSWAYAVMRQESRFNPKARSKRGARGVMQLLPGTAREIARKLKRRPPTIRDLYVPERSIVLGMRHLAALKREFCKNQITAKRCLTMTAVGFNAGRSLARRLHACCRHLPDDLFVERIPYEETRDYVRKVWLVEQIYRRHITACESAKPSVYGKNTAWEQCVRKRVQ